MMPKIDKIKKPKCPICGKTATFSESLDQWVCNDHPSRVIVDSRKYQYKDKLDYKEIPER